MNAHLMQQNKDSWVGFCTQLGDLTAEQFTLSEYKSYINYPTPNLGASETRITASPRIHVPGVRYNATLIFRDDNAAHLREVYNALVRLIIDGKRSEQDFAVALHSIYPCFI